jgi:queuine tRNA-ribosyltransferase
VTAFRFELLGQNGKLRRGRFHTPHGTLRDAVLRAGRHLRDAEGPDARTGAATGAELILANSYHLHVRPGAERIERLGGLHRFMGWDGPILTDSGGYQVFSLGGKVKVDDDGVTFQSVIDGSTHRCTPESVLTFQKQLGPDIAMVLDHCPPGDADLATQRDAHERTLRWARMARDVHDRWGGSARGQAVFGICQGGIDPELRAASAVAMAAMDFDGYAIGGLSVGETKAQMAVALDAAVDHLPAGKIRYMMGVGMPEDLLAATAQGVDMFDCVVPTRHGRNHTAFGAERHDVEAAQRAVRRRSEPARRRLRLLLLPQVFTRLPAPSRRRRRDAGRHPAVDPQHPLPAGPDALDPRAGRRSRLKVSA